jgi:hypothetical protein
MALKTGWALVGRILPQNDISHKEARKAQKESTNHFVLFVPFCGLDTLPWFS